jgi:2'-5' RNA ligase
MNFVRLFTAIDLSPEVIASLERLLSELRPTARISWIPVANLHLTTKFIGEWPESRFDQLRAALSGLSQRPPIEIAVRGVGFFPNPHHPRVFWTGVGASEALAGLAAETGKALATLGVPADVKRFSPHLTLARIKEPVPLVALRQAIAARASLDFGIFSTDRFHLYQSRLSPSGSTYTKLASFPFAEGSPA